MEYYQSLTKYPFIHFTENYRSWLRKIEYILNRPITKFNNSNDINATKAEFWQAKSTPFLF